jgi:hypothetical protein
MAGVIHNIYQAAQSNPVFAGGIGLGLSGLAAFWIRDIPLSLWGLCKRELTTSLTVKSTDQSYHNLIKDIEAACINKNLRSFNISNGMYGSDDSISSVGYGNHLIRYRGKLMHFNLTMTESNNRQATDILRITKLGRSRRIFDDIANSTKNKKSDDLHIHIFNSYWRLVRGIPKRHLNSIFIQKEKTDLITRRLDEFKAKEKWYIDNGIPYQMGILLEGPPGTGKTSLIKAIASYIDYPIYYLQASMLSDIAEAMSLLPSSSMVVIEDIDTSVSVGRRKKTTVKDDIAFSYNAKRVNEGVATEDVKSFNASNLSDVLNSTDGMLSARGRILVVTTNKIDAIDEAVLRAGRIDIKIHVGYADIEIVKAFVDRFYSDTLLDFTSVTLRDDITVADMQELVIGGGSDADLYNLVSCEQ